MACRRSISDVPCRVLGVIIVVLSVLLAAPPAGTAAEVTVDERARIEGIVRDFLMNNPEVIIDSLRAYEEARQREAEKDGAAALATLRHQFERDGDFPVVGNPGGDVTIVEFFDYNCGYCRQVLPTLQEVVKADGNIRWVLVEFPILGAESIAASKAALAVWQLAPDKYFALHAKLMGLRGRVTETGAVRLAEDLGVNGEDLGRMMTDDAIAERLRQNLALGQQINVRGTPAFIIGGTVVPGAISRDQLKDLITAARAS